MTLGVGLSFMLSLKTGCEAHGWPETASLGRCLGLYYSAWSEFAPVLSVCVCVCACMFL